MTLITAREVAKGLQCSESTVRRLTKRGEIPALKVGKLLRYAPDVVEKMLAPKDAA